MIFNVMPRQLTKIYIQARRVYYFLRYYVLRNTRYQVFTARFFSTMVNDLSFGRAPNVNYTWMYLK